MIVDTDFLMYKSNIFEENWMRLLHTLGTICHDVQHMQQGHLQHASLFVDSENMLTTLCYVLIGWIHDIIDYVLAVIPSIIKYVLLLKNQLSTQVPSLQYYDECVLCESACFTTHLNATLTLFHFTLWRSHIQLSSSGNPPTIKSRLPSRPCSCDSLKHVAAVRTLAPGLSGPRGTSFCQSCIINNSQCYHYNHHAYVLFKNKATSTKHFHSHFRAIIVDKMTFSLHASWCQVIPINTINQWLRKKVSLKLHFT